MINSALESWQDVLQDERRRSRHGEGAEGDRTPLGRHRGQVGPVCRPRALQRPRADQHRVQDASADLAEGLPIVSATSSVL